MRQYGATWAEINLDTLEQNYKNLKQLITHKTKVCCVLKANAYGHGSVEIAKLYENMGIDYIAVSNMDEALELRNAGIKLPITCLSFVPEYQYEELLKNNIDIPIYTLSQGIALNNIALKHQKVANVHIKIDSGMSRIGFLCNDMAIRDIKQLSRLDGLHFKGIFTHFARADERDKFHTQKQFYVFSKLIQSLEKQNITFDIRHCCNTAATICYPEYHLDMVRLGIALFGYYPSKEVSEKNVNMKKEILAGITTFLTMAYIIAVNPSTLAAAGMDAGALVTATCLAAALGCFIMGFVANLPFALASGMGLNAFFAYTVVLKGGVPWETALTAVFVEGIIFIFLTLFKVREAVVNSIPLNMKHGVTAGIGIFIAFIGLKGCGLVIANEATFVSMGHLSPTVIFALFIASALGAYIPIVPFPTDKSIFPLFTNLVFASPFPFI